jgi:hypothetical protein
VPPNQNRTLPSGRQWLHEIKHDGFRVIARKNGTQVRLYSRPGNDLTHRFPLIVEALAFAPAPALSMAKLSLATATARPRLIWFAIAITTKGYSSTPSTLSS